LEDAILVFFSSLRPVAGDRELVFEPRKTSNAKTVRVVGGGGW
jgi:hypothetical protein